MKVLVTIGSMTEKQFTRLFRIIEDLCSEGVLDGKDVTAQVGFDAYRSEQFRCFDMITDEEFKALIAQSDLIITHAGTGTVTSALKQGKKIIVFPRMAKYDEHYDDHQLELADLFAGQGYVMKATTKAELRACIARLDAFVPVPFVSNNERMNCIVLDFIEK